MFGPDKCGKEEKVRFEKSNEANDISALNKLSNACKLTTRKSI